MDPNNPNSTETERQRWAACQPGELQRMAVQIKSDRRAQRLNRATVVVALLVVAGLGAFYLRNWTSNTPEPISCNEVVAHLPAYAAGEIDDGLKSRIDYHLTHCKSCHDRYHDFDQVARLLQPAFPLAAVLVRFLR